MSNKKEQIIVRLSGDKKEKLQKIADRLGTDMSSLVREKIDEIINEYEQPQSDFARTIDYIQENNIKYAENKEQSASTIFNGLRGTGDSKAAHNAIMTYFDQYTKELINDKLDDYFSKILEEQLKDKK